MPISGCTGTCVRAASSAGSRPTCCPSCQPKTRAVVPVALDNEPEYRLAEEDVIAWLQSQPLDLHELDARVAAALRAERLVRLNALKLLAARGKLHGALALDPRFPVLRRAARRLRPPSGDPARGARALPDRAARARRGQPPRPATRRCSDFQARRAAIQLIVCSIEVAGQGITLTRASNVAFLELDWTPAKHDQAEDRCHRIGQAGRGQRRLPACGGHDRRDDRNAARAQAGRDRRGHRWARGGRARSG